MGPLVKGSLRKVCGNSAENSRKFSQQKYFYCVRKGCGNSVEISRKLVKIFLQWPLPERPHKWDNLGRAGVPPHNVEDGRSASLTAPHGPSQQECIRQSLGEARVDPLVIQIQESLRSIVWQCWLPANCLLVAVNCLSIAVNCLLLSCQLAVNWLSLVAWFARIDSHDSRESPDSRESGDSSDSCESAWRAIKIGVSIANDSRESRCESPVPLSGCQLPKRG